MYDYLVVGKGLFGSAAGRYLSELSDSVGIVGPDEPADWSRHQGVFASHYDEARVASFTGPDAVWTRLDQASMGQYRALEEQSGVPFYTPSGRLSVTRRGEEVAYPYLPVSAANSQAYTSSTLPQTLPLRFPPDYDIILEHAPSGTINPRAMIRAQLAIAEQQGADIIRQMVSTVRNKGSEVVVRLANGQTLWAKKVLLATGAFSNCFGLLERKLALNAVAITTVLAELCPKDAAQLRHLPPINYKIERGPVTHLTILPPLPYPNGRFRPSTLRPFDPSTLRPFDPSTGSGHRRLRAPQAQGTAGSGHRRLRAPQAQGSAGSGYYIRLSCSTETDQILPTFSALRNWFAQPCHFPYLAETQAILRSMLPDLTILSWQTKPCVVSYTPSGKPFIDRLDCLDRLDGLNGLEGLNGLNELKTGRIYVAIGGNGGSAHPSDAIGQLAANLMRHERWTSDLDPTPFQLQFAEDWSEWMETLTPTW